VIYGLCWVSTLAYCLPKVFVMAGKLDSFTDKIYLCLSPGKIAEFIVVDKILCPDWLNRERRATEEI
jgi:hypothetical protein